MRWRLAVVLLLILPPVAIARDSRRAAVEAVLPGAYGQCEYCAGTDQTVFARPHDPDANERKRLVVEWGKAAMGYVDEPDYSAGGNEDGTGVEGRQLIARQPGAVHTRTVADRIGRPQAPSAD